MLKPLFRHYTSLQMRRFINLIDALYEESVQVIVLAEDVPTKLLKLTAKEKASPHDEVDRHMRLVLVEVKYKKIPT